MLNRGEKHTLPTGCQGTYCQPTCVWQMFPYHIPLGPNTISALVFKGKTSSIINSSSFMLVFSPKY